MSSANQIMCRVKRQLVLLLVRPRPTVVVSHQSIAAGYVELIGPTSGRICVAC
jgi:hypothetical protein